MAAAFSPLMGASPTAGLTLAEALEQRERAGSPVRVLTTLMIMR